MAEIVMCDNNEIVAKWNALKSLVESMEIDIYKNVYGCVAAGSRCRRGLRKIRELSKQMSRSMIKADKKRRDTRRELRKERKNNNAISKDSAVRLDKEGSQV